MSTQVTAAQKAGDNTAGEAVLDLGVAKQQFGESLTRLALRRLKKDYLTQLALAIIIIMALLALFAPVISNVLGVSYKDTSTAPGFLEIGAPGHPLGTDDLGRDHLSRLLYAGRVSLGIAVSAGIASLVIGMSVGVISGFYVGGRMSFVDDFLMWFITTLNSIPQLFLLLIIASVVRERLQGQGTVLALILILTVLGWTGTMRFVRGETLSQRERDYVLAARAVGASDLRIMFTHIMPNIFSILIIILATDIGGLILSESALSFLGLGVKPPTPSWGNMLTNAQSLLSRGPHLAVLPGLLIVITVLCLFIIGDGLRDAFDPRANKNT